MNDEERKLKYFSVVQANFDCGEQIIFRIQSTDPIRRDDVTNMIEAHADAQNIQGLNVKVKMYHCPDQETSQLLYDMFDGDKVPDKSIQSMIDRLEQSNPNAEFTNMRERTIN